MEPEFITFQKFTDAALADELIELLDRNTIPYRMEEESSGFDPSLVMSNAAVDYAVKIKSEDFEKLNQLLEKNEERPKPDQENAPHITNGLFIFKGSCHPFRKCIAANYQDKITYPNAGNETYAAFASII